MRIDKLIKKFKEKLYLENFEYDDIIKKVPDWKLDDKYENKVKEIVDLTNKINKYAVIPVKEIESVDYYVDNLYWYRKDEIFNNLSSDKSSLEKFKLSKIDWNMAAVMVDIDYLIRTRGNDVGGIDKEGPIMDAYKKNIKLELPYYDLQKGKVDEGNHRIWMLKELGYKSAPVILWWN